MNKVNALLLATALLAAPFPATAKIINLSATDYSKGSAVEVFEAGTYTVSLIKGDYTAWSVNSSIYSWVDYYEYSFGGTTYSTGTLNRARYTTADEAFDVWSALGPVTLSFTAATAVTFAIQDAEHSFRDNLGGVSLNIAAVPEPATWGMMVLGFLGLGMVLRRKSGQRMVIA